jgi:F-type H+-transporting ATPase subunit a
MNSAELIETPEWSFGLITGYPDNPLLNINSEIVTHTWVIMIALALCLAFVNFLIKHTTIGRFLLVQFVAFFVDLTKQSLGHFSYTHCVFSASLFIFIALCNTASIIPWLDEPTKDLNTTLALGMISFLYVQLYIIKTRGIRSYIKELFQPIFVMLPLNVIGKLSSIVSISFRLFGNIFGGAIITKLYFSAIRGSIILELLGIITGMNFLIVAFFTLFEGLLQAFVFTMLTLTYISIGTQESSH